MSPHPESTLIDKQSGSALSANAADAAATFAPQFRVNTKASTETMKNLTAVTAIAAGFATALIWLAGPATAAPSGPGSAADTITALEAGGNRVIVNRQSNTTLDNAEVVSVRQGQPIREYVWDAQGDDKVLQTTGNVVFIDIK